MVKVGCCGFPVSYKRYMKEFKTVEVQITFYRRITKKQVDNWLKSAPFDFEFIFKAPQCVTHPPDSPTYRRSDLPYEERRECGGFRLTEVVKREMDYMIDVISPLNVKGLLFQASPKFDCSDINIENLKRFFEYYRHLFESYFIALEVRHPSWSATRIREVFSDIGLIHAVDPFIHGPQVVGDFTYYRMHGNLKTYRYDYSREELVKLKGMCKKSGYVFFNNSHMFKNAREFLEILKD